MNFEEHAGKPLLAQALIPIPRGRVARTPGEACAVAGELGEVIIKAQVPAGKRGKAGGIKPADSIAEAETVAAAILGMEIGGHTVEKLLVEERAPIAAEYYAAILNDPVTKGPLAMFSAEGGMDIEEIAEKHPAALKQHAIDVRKGFSKADAAAMVKGTGVDETTVAEILIRLYDAYIANDAELLEINPLAKLEDGRVVALDCKFVMDDSAIKRHTDTADYGTPDKLTALEQRGKDLDLKFIELDGDIGVLANGAGLTMTTMDVVSHYGGKPANFLEIGGEAYTRATPALKLVLDNPGVKALVVNFCGAFARTDVMTEGVINALKELKPKVPAFFSVHGTGSVEARSMLKEQMNIDPYPTMDDAIQAAIKHARGAP